MKGGEEMVEIAIKDDGGAKGTESGDFVNKVPDGAVKEVLK